MIEIGENLTEVIVFGIFLVTFVAMMWIIKRGK